jgi:diguanylate cyclase (GGDEF)-like protein
LKTNTYSDIIYDRNILKGSNHMDSSNPSTVLIIDDDSNITNLLSKRLSQEGFNVITAKDGQSGLQLAAQKLPDIILLDLLMPEMSGKDVLRELKSDSKTLSIPVIILSAIADTSDKIDGLSLGANDYIVKPFRFKEVLARVQTQLRIASTHKELEQKHNDLLEKNKILKKLAITDPLTGLFNKGYLMKRLRSEVSRSIRYNQPLCCIMVDIDSFKKFNDTYGHIVGDNVLKTIAKTLKDASRDCDIVTRYGGEEFLIICPNTTLDGACNLAERIRETVYSTSLPLEDNEDLFLSISAGVKCMYYTSEADTKAAANDMINAADLALYKAKSNGKNKVVVAE